MIYLLESAEFVSKKNLKYICNRIMSTGYISKSNAKEIEKIAGIKGIIDKIEERVDHIYEFFESKPMEFIDDVLFEFFDTSEYDYKVKIGCHIHSIGIGNSDFIIDDEYQNMDNKREYLLSKLITFAAELNEESIKKVKERGKLTPGKIRLSYLYIPHNYFKTFLKIKPLVLVQIRHKNYINYWDIDHDTYKGWDEIYGQSDDSLAKKIKKRFDSDKVFGPCTVSSDRDIYTSRSYYNEDNDEVIARGVLLKSDLYIKLT